MRVILILCTVAAFIYAGLCLVLFFAQRSFIYYPQPQSSSGTIPTLTLDINGEKLRVSIRPTGPGAFIGGPRGRRDLLWRQRRGRLAKTPPSIAQMTTIPRVGHTASPRVPITFLFLSERRNEACHEIVSSQ